MMYSLILRGMRRGNSVRAFGLAVVFVAGIAAQSFAQTPPLENAAENENQRSLATNISNICPRLGAMGGFSLPGDQGDLFARCNSAIELAGGGSGMNTNLVEAEETLQQFTAEQIAAQEAVIDGTVQRQTRAVSARISALSRRLTTLMLAEVPPAKSEERVLLASADWQIATDGSTVTAEDWRGIGLFLTSSYNFGNKDATDLEAGYDFDDFALTGGVDYFFLNNLAAGLALSYSYTDIEFDDNGGDLKADSYSVALYSLWNPLEQLGLSGYASYARLDYDSKRKLNFFDVNAGGPGIPGQISRTAKGDTNANQFELTGNVYYDFTSGPWTYGPTGWLSYVYLDIDGFRETGAEGLNFEYDDQNSDSLQSAIGGQASYNFSTSKGVALLYGRAHWLHEFEDDARTTDLGYVSDPFTDSPTIQVITDDPDRDWALVGAGASFVFPGGISAFTDFETVVFKEDVESYTLTAGLRLEF